MRQLLFLGCNISKEIVDTLNSFESTIVKDMNENEVKAYRLGVKNATNILSTLLDGFGGYIIVNADEKEYQRELDLDDLEKMLIESEYK